MNPVDFGKKITMLRKKQGLTQSELAQRLNVSDKAVSKWERGAGFPEITQLPVLSDIFGVSVDYLMKGNSRGIVIAGNILLDIINMIDKYPSKNMLATVFDLQKAVGGAVPNTIIDLAVIDPELYLSAVGKVGSDEYGRFVVSEMKKYGIDTSRVVISTSSPTSYTNVMTEVETGERTFFHMKGSNSDFSQKDIDLDSLDCEIFHVGYILLLDELDKDDEEYGTKMARLLHDVKAKGIKTSIDVVSEDSERFAAKVIPALRYCSYATMNEVESGRVTGLSPRNDDGTLNVSNIKKTMEKFFEYGVREKVIVHCPEGGFIMNRDGEFTAVPSLKLPKGYIKGSVGAGDAFTAGCLYGLYKGFDDRRILEFSSAAAACNLSAPDSISGMRSRAYIEDMLKNFEKNELKI